MTRPEKAIVTGAAATIIAESALALMHQGGLGLIAGAAIGAATYLTIDDIEKKIAVNRPEPSPLEQPSLPKESRNGSKNSSLAYRLFNGKSVRRDAESMTQQQREDQQEDAEDFEQVIEAVAQQYPVAPRRDIIHNEQHFVAQHTPKSSMPVQNLALTQQQRLAEARRSIIPPRSTQNFVAQTADAGDASVWDESWYEDDDEQSLPSATKDNEMFTFSQILEKGFTPSLDKIYLGRLVDGTDVYVTAKDLCHVALAGLTGNGKSSIMRLIMAQLCKIGVTVLLLNPHYMQWDHSGGEDWTPYEPYLEKSPIDCAGYETIGTYLEWTAKTLLANRIERARKGKPIGKPFFIVIDELPAIVAECKDVPSHIAKLLREGRKYGIFLIVASQDFQVKTIGFDGGGVRKCFKTAFYVGGDVATAKALLNDDNQKDPIPENDLGKGTIMLRCSATKKAVLTKVPYVDNESLYRLLGGSTFSSADEKPLIAESNHDSEQSNKTKEQSKPLTLDAVLALAEKVDNETLLALIDRLPVVRDGEDIDTGELAIVDDEEIQSQDIDSYQRDIVRQPETPKTLVPIMPDKGIRTDDVPINTLVAVWNNLPKEDKTVDGLATAFNCNRNQAYKAYKRIQACFDAALQKEE